VLRQAAREQFARFGGQRPPNLRVGIVELPTPAKLPRMVLDAFISLQAGTEVLEKSRAIVGALLSALLELLNVTPDGPVPERQAYVDGD
jgi:hypothetical protein